MSFVFLLLWLPCDSFDTNASVAVAVAVALAFVVEDDDPGSFDTAGTVCSHSCSSSSSQPHASASLRTPASQSPRRRTSSRRVPRVPARSLFMRRLGAVHD